MGVVGVVGIVGVAGAVAVEGVADGAGSAVEVDGSCDGSMVAAADSVAMSCDGHSKCTQWKICNNNNNKSKFIRLAHPGAN